MHDARIDAPESELPPRLPPGRGGNTAPEEQIAKLTDAIATATAAGQWAIVQSLSASLLNLTEQRDVDREREPGVHRVMTVKQGA